MLPGRALRHVGSSGWAIYVVAPRWLDGRVESCRKLLVVDEPVTMKMHQSLHLQESIRLVSLTAKLDGHDQPHDPSHEQ